MAVSYGYPPHKDSTKGQDGEFNDGKVGTSEFSHARTEDSCMESLCCLSRGRTFVQLQA